MTDVSHLEIFSSREVSGWSKAAQDAFREIVQRSQTDPDGDTRSQESVTVGFLRQKIAMLDKAWQLRFKKKVLALMVVSGTVVNSVRRVGPSYFIVLNKYQKCVSGFRNCVKAVALDGRQQTQLTALDACLEQLYECVLSLLLYLHVQGNDVHNGQSSRVLSALDDMAKQITHGVEGTPSAIVQSVSSALRSGTSTVVGAVKPIVSKVVDSTVENPYWLIEKKLELMEKAKGVTPSEGLGNAARNIVRAANIGKHAGTVASAVAGDAIGGTVGDAVKAVGSVAGAPGEVLAEAVGSSVEIGAQLLGMGATWWVGSETEKAFSDFASSAVSAVRTFATPLQGSLTTEEQALEKQITAAERSWRITNWFRGTNIQDMRARLDIVKNGIQHLSDGDVLKAADLTGVSSYQVFLTSAANVLTTLKSYIGSAFELFIRTLAEYVPSIGRLFGVSGGATATVALNTAPVTVAMTYYMFMGMFAVFAVYAVAKILPTLARWMAQLFRVRSPWEDPEAVEKLQEQAQERHAKLAALAVQLPKATIEERLRSKYLTAVDMAIKALSKQSSSRKGDRIHDAELNLLHQIRDEFLEPAGKRFTLMGEKRKM